MTENKKLKVAVIQMTSGSDKEKNLESATSLINYAIKKGAEFIALPEVFNFRGHLDEAANAAEEIPGPSTDKLSKVAKENKVWILIGSMMEIIRAESRELRAEKKNRSSQLAACSSKPYNTSVLIDPKGNIVAKYSKMHLFDIKLKGKEILESSRNQAGAKPCLTEVHGIKTALSICYDLRFPELFRDHSENGAEIICVPSSFTKVTGEAHWETLLRARAIENQCFVLAPNQAGIGSGGVKTYGHSMIIDPWGKILAEAPDTGEAVITADLDFTYLKKIRENLPCLKHRKM
jgi:predicted amidohydrolase